MHITLHKNRKSVVVVTKGGICPRVGEIIRAEIEEYVGFQVDGGYETHKIGGVVSRVVHEFSTAIGIDQQFIHIYLK